jgi:hypothetical protein
VPHFLILVDVDCEFNDGTLCHFQVSTSDELSEFRCQFQQHFMLSFNAQRSKKKQKYSYVVSLFALLGSALVKAAQINVGEIDPRWSIKTGQQLKDEGLVGPSVDHTGSDQGHFAYMTGSLESRDPPVSTDLTSKDIGPGGEFPIECVSFKFDLSVSNFFQKRASLRPQDIFSLNFEIF